MVLDGTGAPARRADVRIVGSQIVQVGHVKPHAGDRVIDVNGLTVAPGFIDAHSHANGGIWEDPDAETQIRQGITTAVVGEDGDSALPVYDFLGRIDKHPASINFATFVGQGSIRGKVMGNKQTKPTPAEMAKMKQLVVQSMHQGALGLSTGLEYEPGRYASTNEVAELTIVAGRYGGSYISHVRNEDNHAFEAFKELIEICKKAHVPGEINHIKLCSERVWGRAGEVSRMMAEARKKGIEIDADVYPYTYWQSTIRVIIPTENFDDRKQWEQGLKDVGGASHVLLTSFTPDKTWAGKTIEQISTMTGKDPITLCQEIVNRCYKSGKKESESVVVTAMSEDDVTAFIKAPNIVFCSDGGLHGTHPRGAGSFPRVLAKYVREKHAITLAEAVHKMTMLAAKRFGFRDRGRIAKGMKADITVFDPEKVQDQATTASPEAKPDGIPIVIVNGQVVLDHGDPTGVHSGVAIRRR
jgi:N-acyl-D-amino-acid deacylase